MKKRSYRKRELLLFKPVSYYIQPLIQIGTAARADAVPVHTAPVGGIRRTVEAHRSSTHITALAHVQNGIANVAPGAAKVEAA